MKKENSVNAVWGNIAKEEDEQYEKDKLIVPAAEKEKANFGLSGALAKDEVTGNMYNGELHPRHQYRPISMILQLANRLCLLLSNPQKESCSNGLSP